VLGGAGYTREWPVEQGLRDARGLTVFEGTTGMQAQDITLRRLRAPGAAGYHAFLQAAREDAAKINHAGLNEALATFTATAEALIAADPATAEAGSTPFLALAGVVATGWIAARLIAAQGDDPLSRQLAATGRYALGDIAARAALTAAQALMAAERVSGFEVMVEG